MRSDDLVAALKSDAPLTEDNLVELESDINSYDCEEWSAELGHAIVARLRRDSMAAEPPLWQPIRTAPRHATLITLWSPTTHTYAIQGRYWEQDEQWQADTGETLYPVAWMPLPKPSPEMGALRDGRS